MTKKQIRSRNEKSDDGIFKRRAAISDICAGSAGNQCADNPLGPKLRSGDTLFNQLIIKKQLHINDLIVVSEQFRNM
jgi:hypothetical protein